MDTKQTIIEEVKSLNTGEFDSPACCIIDRLAFEGLKILFSHRTIKDYDIDPSVLPKLKAMDDVNIRLADGGMVDTDTDTVVRRTETKVWPVSGDRAASISLNVYPHDSHITVGEMKVRLRVLSRFSDQWMEDIFYPVLVYSSSNTQSVRKLVQRLANVAATRARASGIIHVWGGRDMQVNSSMDWSDLVLDNTVLARTRKDLEGWIKAEDRYGKMRVPYRRGYLFEGPPGNGKTAVTRVMMSNYKFFSATMNFTNRYIDDSDLHEMFAVAAQNAPAMVLLEDVDRLFVPGRERTSKVTLQGLLNSLDGLAVQNGVVVVATANHPELLDPAIRLRPGRFDMPVYFDNPNDALRDRYIRHAIGRCELTGTISDEAIKKVVDESSGMSMAFVKSIFEVAAAADEFSDKALIAAAVQAKEYFEYVNNGDAESDETRESTNPQSPDGIALIDEYNVRGSYMRSTMLE